MASFQSRTIVHAQANAVYAFLSDYRQHAALQPVQVQDWNAGEDAGSFTVQPLGSFSLSIVQRIPQTRVHIRADDSSPVPLEFIWRLDAAGENQCRVELSIRAELNMMMKMLASKPIQDLADYQIKKLEQHFSA